MNIRPLLGFLVAGAVVCAGPGAVVSAGPRGISIRGGVTQPVFSYTDAIRETVYVQSTIDGDGDGDLDLLATDIIRPRQTQSGLKVPVIYEMSPYYQSSGRGNEGEVKRPEDGDFVPEVFPLYYDNYFVPRGYAVVLQDMRGTRNSEGCMVLGGRGELVDAEATIAWLNGSGKAFTAEGKPVKAAWSTGKVGMIGKSYDGTVANGAASLGIDGLTTIVPIAAISRWYDYHLYNGVQFLNAYLTPALFSFIIDQEAGDDEERGAEWAEATATENTTCSARGAEISGRAADPRGDYTEFWDERDYLKDADRVKASVFLIHGLNDMNVKPNHFVQWWDALARRDVPRKLWLAQVAHVDPFDFRREHWVRTLHRWFDFWLHGVRNGIMDEPMVDIERENGTWRTEKTWPHPAARPVTLYPSGDQGSGTLEMEPPAEGTATFDDRAADERRMIRNPNEASGERLVYLTPKLRKPLRVSGHLRVELAAAVDRPDTNLTALLVDYGPAVRVLPDVRTGAKESCHGQSSKTDDACYRVTEKLTATRPEEIVSRGWLDAKHYQSLRSSTPLVPGTRYTLSWEMFGDDYVFAKGHRIGVVVSGSDPNFTVPDPSAASVTVSLGPSHVVLPIVGGVGALQRALQ